MSTNAYTEDQLIEPPAIGLFAEFGWITLSGLQNLHQKQNPLPRLLSGQVNLKEN